MTGVELFTIGTTAITLADAAIAASAIVSAAGAFGQAKAQAQTQRYNAAVQRRNADAARNAAAFEERKKREDVARHLSAQRAAAGASGVLIEEGSPLQVMAESAAQGELDALAIRFGGEIRAGQHGSAAGLLDAQAGGSATAGGFGVATSLLAGGQQIGRLHSSPPKIGGASGSYLGVGE